MERQLCDGPGYLDEETFRVYSKWCHTGGGFKGAEPVAQAISLIVYGRIIARIEDAPRPQRDASEQTIAAGL
jgi:hypothetical protein